MVILILYPKTRAENRPSLMASPRGIQTTCQSEPEEDMGRPDGQGPPNARTRPKFHEAPRFKAPEQLDINQHTNLPDLFSPQRRGVKYAQGGSPRSFATGWLK